MLADVNFISHCIAVYNSVLRVTVCRLPAQAAACECFVVIRVLAAAPPKLFLAPAACSHQLFVDNACMHDA